MSNQSKKLIILIVAMALYITIGIAENVTIRNAEYYDNLINSAIKSNAQDSTLARLYMDYQYQIYISDINKAISYLNKTVEIYQKLKERTKLAAVYTRLGQVYHQLQLYQIALQYLTKAHKIQVELEDFAGAAYTNCDIGNVFFAYTQYSIAESYYRNSMNYFRKHHDNYGTSVMLNNIGLCKMSINQPDSALTYFTMGYNLRNKGNDRFVINHSFNYLATAHAALHNYDKAIDYYTKVIDDIKQWKDAPQYAIQLKADAQFNLRDLYKEQKKYVMADQYLEEALISYNSISDTAGTIKTLLAMANDEFERKEYSDAIQHSEAAYQLSKIKGLMNTSHKVLGFLTKLHIQMGNTTEAQKYFTAYFALSDSVIKQYTSSGLTQTHAAIQNFYTDRENEALLIKEKLIVRYLVIIAVLLLIALLLYFYVLITKKSSIKNLKSLADATFEAILIHDAGKIVEVNNQLCKMSGYERNELINKRILDLNCVELTEETIRSMISNSDATYESKAYAKDGYCADVEITSRPLSYRGKLMRVVAMRDITERKHYIDELLKTNQQNKELIATKDKLFSIIAHDLKNPFNAIMGFSNILRQDIDQFSRDELLDMITMIYDTSLFAHDLLDNLLEWARYQTGALKFNPQNINLLEQVKTVLAIANSNAAVKQLEIKVDIEPDCIVFADFHMLKTVLLNLISNSIKFTPGFGVISIKGWAENHETKIEISDTGIGINQKLLENLFKIENMQSTKGTNNEPGTGLGLILCYELIMKHKGTIAVTSQEQKGTLITITLPDKQ